MYGFWLRIWIIVLSFLALSLSFLLFLFTQFFQHFLIVFHNLLLNIVDFWCFYNLRGLSQNDQWLFNQRPGCCFTDVRIVGPDLIYTTSYWKWTWCKTPRGLQAFLHFGRCRLANTEVVIVRDVLLFRLEVAQKLLWLVASLTFLLFKVIFETDHRCGTR